MQLINDLSIPFDYETHRASIWMAALLAQDKDLNAHPSPFYTLIATVLSNLYIGINVTSSSCRGGVSAQAQIVAPLGLVVWYHRGHRLLSLGDKSVCDDCAEYRLHRYDSAAMSTHNTVVTWTAPTARLL